MSGQDEFYHGSEWFQSVMGRSVNYSREILRLSTLSIILIGTSFLVLYKTDYVKLSYLEGILLLVAFVLMCAALVLSIVHTNRMIATMADTLGESPGTPASSLKNQNSRKGSAGAILLQLAVYSFAFSILIFGATIILVCLSAVTTNHATIPGDDDKIEVDFVQVNDVYEIAPLDNGRLGGIARVAAFKQECLRKNPNTMLVIAGDFLSPSVYSNMKQDSILVAGRQMVDAMNAAGFDLAIFGNHEFDVSQNQLNTCINESNFQWLSSNAFNSGGSRKHFKKGNEDIPETYIKEFVDDDGTVAKVGFIGITINSNHSDYVQYDTTFENEKKLYDELSKSCDAVVAVTHQSITEDMDLARRLPGLAVIIGGHEHDMQFKKVGNVYITKAHANAKSVFYLRLKINKKDKSISLLPELKCLDTSVSLDCLTDAVVKKWLSFSDDYFKTSGFHIDSVIYRGPSLDGRDEQVRKDSANVLAKIVVKAMEAIYPDAVMAVTNAGSIRIDDVLKSPLTQYDILRALPFGGSTKKASLSGDTLMRMLDTGLKNIGTGGFLQYSSFVKKKSDGWYIRNSKIKQSSSYLVAIAEYLRKGKEPSMDFLKNIRVLDSAKAGATDIKSDIRLAVIRQMVKLKSGK